MFYWITSLRKYRDCFFCLTIAVLLSSCEQQKDTVFFYPIGRLVAEQISNLAKQKAKLHKQAVLKQQADSIFYIPQDTVGWAEELEVFRQLDVINKPINKGRYLVDDNLYDPRSNLTVKAFTAKDPLPVKSLRVFYDVSVLKPRKIEAVFEETNTLYKSLRLLSMEFQQINDQMVLTSYIVSGGQKMTLGDSVTFMIKGKIQID